MVQNLEFITFSLLPFLLFMPISADTELRRLMEIKASLDPENKFLKTWQINGDPCGGSFEGVACNDRRKIANISLQGRGLAGKLPPAIGDLKSLSGLYLHYNSISGEIPAEIGNLTELVDLYLNVNNFSGIIPSEIGHMASLQVLDLCCNQLTGSIPTALGSLSNFGVLSLQYNQLNGTIPPSLGNLSMLKRLDLSYNHLSGPIPMTIANIQPLQFLDVRNNSLSGVVPIALKRLNAGFSYGNNTNLCGAGYPPLRACTAFDNADVIINTPQPFGLNILKNHTSPKHEPKTANMRNSAYPPTSSNHTRIPQAVIVVGAITAAVILVFAGLLMFFRYRRRKQKIGSNGEVSESRLSNDHAIDLHIQTASPLVSLAYSAGWDPLADSLNTVLQRFRCNLEEIESATQYFSEANVIGRGNFSTVYRGVLRDRSVVAIKSISLSSCKAEEEEFVKGMNLLATLQHENLVGLRGFCCSRGRGECYLVYDFAPNGNLLKYLTECDGSGLILDWSSRVNIINGIAKGLHYLHKENASKPPVVHQNICAEKILIDGRFNPLISDAGIPKILADDSIFSTLKISAAMGYLAPEYITTGRFTEKSDVYAFGVTVLHILAGTQQITTAMRSAAESCRLEDFMDRNLDGNSSLSEATLMVKLALSCTEELPDKRPDMEAVVQEINRLCCSGS